MNQYNLNLTQHRLLVNELQSIVIAIGRGSFTPSAIEERAQLCLNILHKLEPNNLSEASSYCPQSYLPLEQRDSDECMRRPCLCSGAKTLSNASLQSGPAHEMPKNAGPDFTSKTPVEPVPSSPEYTGSNDRVRSKKRELKMVYVAGPYWHPNPQRRELNRAAARQMASYVADAGYFPVTPHLNTAGFEDLTAQSEKFYRKGCIELLDACDAMILCQNWQESLGSKAEVDFAKAYNIPVLFSIEHMEKHFEQQTGTPSAFGPQS